ncbi:MAG: flippase activity-associated protein Agl23 [Terrimicrobiaceae bacterium]
MLARLSKLPFLEIAIFSIAIFLRVWAIELKPPHFDEGVNGWFADQMTANGYYHYDPTNYHGPLHFYAVFLSQTLFGRHLWALRLPAIIASLLCIWALLRFREFFGARTVRIAGLAMAVSPAFVFYGRYSIHESWQVLFSILLLWGILGIWQSGERRYFFTAVFSVVGLVLTKETYLLHVGCFLLAGGVLWLWQHVLPSRPLESGSMGVPPNAGRFAENRGMGTLPMVGKIRMGRMPVPLKLSELSVLDGTPVLPVRGSLQRGPSFAPQLWTRDDAILAAGISLLLIVFFYSGNFLDFPSLRGLYQTFSAWFQTGVEAAGHAKSTYQIGPLNYYWVALMARYEWPALAGLIACVRYVAPSDARFRYTAIMAGGVLIAYSIIPYKTPWCIISMIWPFYLILAGLLGEWAEIMKKRWLPWIVMAPLFAASAIFCWRLNFQKFFDDSEPYVYVQTYPEIETFTGPLLSLAKEDARQYHMSGLILLDSYYPLPWMLGDFTRVGYYNKDQAPADWDAGFIAVEKKREGEVEGHLTQPYFKRSFHLRSAQDECTAYFSEALFKSRFGGEPEFHPTAR